MSQEELQAIFIAKCIAAHGVRFDYSLVKYVNNRTPLSIKCKECNVIFTPIPFNFLKLKNCPNCNVISQRNTNVDFINKAKEIHGNNYDYSLAKYINAKTKVEIKCNKCNTSFFQLPRGHIYEKQGCPSCRQSHGEQKIKLLLEILNVKFIPQKTYVDCIGVGGGLLKFDYYLPDQNVCIEFDGNQHTDKKSKYWSIELEQNDKIKNDYCKSNNIKLKRISFKDLDKIDSILKSFLF